MKAERVTHGTIHRAAFCQARDCGWEDAAGGLRSIEAVSRSAKRHTEKTGHTVVVESGSSFEYRAG